MDERLNLLEQERIMGVKSSGSVRAVKIKKMLELLTITHRASGSWEELQAAELINEQFIRFGYDSQIEIFDAASHNATDALLDVDGKSFTVLPSLFSAAGEVFGELVYLGNCSDPFHLKNEVRGKIGFLFSSGNLIDRLNFLLELEANGMVGLIVVSPSQNSIVTKAIRFAEIKNMPIIATSWNSGNELARFIGRKAHLKVEWCKNPRKNKSQNVVAKLPGTGPYWMVVSAHHDTAPHIPGALDNGGGTCMLLELAKSFAVKPLPATIYFVSTGSEENGHLSWCGAGAAAFYHKHRDQLNTCIAHVEIDDIGNALGIPQIFYRGNKTFTDLLFDKKITDKYVTSQRKLHSCDSGTASKYGLPFVWFTDAMLTPRPWYHTPDDQKDKMDFDKCAGYFDPISTFIYKLAHTNPFYPYICENNLIIRPAYYEDLDAVKEINKVAFEPVSLHRINEKFFQEELGGKPWHVYKNRGIEEGFESCLDSLIVCEKNGRVVGYATGAHNEETMIAEIGNNAVLPEYQGQGIGKAMQKEIARRMKEAGFTRLSAAE